MLQLRRNALRSRFSVLTYGATVDAKRAGYKSETTYSCFIYRATVPGLACFTRSNKGRGARGEHDFDDLAYYAEHFNTVEPNHTFYPPAAKTRNHGLRELRATSSSA